MIIDTYICSDIDHYRMFEKVADDRPDRYIGSVHKTSDPFGSKTDAASVYYFIHASGHRGADHTTWYRAEDALKEYDRKYRETAQMVTKLP